MAKLSTYCKLHILMMVAILITINGLVCAETATDDPAAYLKYERCQAELALGENNYADAKIIADKIVAEAFDGPKNWRRGNLLHHGYRILGMVALSNGNIEAAKGHLLNSAVTHSGSPQLNSFGPNMSLAKALLDNGETEFVLEYFELCKRFWNTDKLAKWSADVKDGKIPDFGANLVYGIDLPGSRTCPNESIKYEKHT